MGGLLYTDPNLKGMIEVYMGGLLYTNPQGIEVGDLRTRLP